MNEKLIQRRKDLHLTQKQVAEKVKPQIKSFRLYRIWSGMKQRCFNKNAPCYKNYGGRGITICEEWLISFNSFSDWSIANGFREQPGIIPRCPESLEIDRIDPNKNYCPENCRWVTKKINCMKLNDYSMRVNLRKARLDANISILEISKILNIKVQIYQDIENGHRGAKLKLWDRIEIIFGISKEILKLKKRT